MSDFARVKLAAAATIGVSSLAGIYYWYRSKSKEVPPQKWKKVGTLEEIFFYPIKSCGPIVLESADCGILGIYQENYKDRMLMLINSENKQVTARVYPKMVTIQPKLIGNQLIITAPEMNDLDIDFEAIADGETIKANFYGIDTYLVLCGPEYDKWFSKFILDKDSGLRLVYYSYPVPTKPIVSKTFKNGIFQNEDTGSLQDVSSYNLINQTSVDELNTRLSSYVDPRQFRGTLLMKSITPPYEEDKWKWIKIGDKVIFRNIAPCYRCIFPNINAFTGEPDPKGEPLKTLKTYRLVGPASPAFGVQLGIRETGVIKKGDIIYAEDTS